LAEKSSRDWQTDCKNLVWFGEIERKLAKLSMTTLLTVLPFNYFMVIGIYIPARKADMYCNDDYILSGCPYKTSAFTVYIYSVVQILRGTPLRHAT
jgi:hypothetical protein